MCRLDFCMRWMTMLHGFPYEGEQRMAKSFLRFLVALSLATASSLHFASADQPPLRFNLTDLGLGKATGINDVGQVVGQSQIDKPFIWSGKTGKIALPLCPELPSCSNRYASVGDINNQG